MAQATIVLTTAALAQVLEELPVGAVVMGVDRGYFAEATDNANMCLQAGDVILARDLASSLRFHMGDIMGGTNGGEFPVRPHNPVAVGQWGQPGAYITGIEQVPSVGAPTYTLTLAKV